MADKHDSDLPKSDKKSGPGNTPGTPEKDPKDLPETSAVGEDPNEKKNTPPPDKQPHGPGKIDNAAQDPNHPANKTLAKDHDAMRPGHERDKIEGSVYTSENLRTAQEVHAEDHTMGIGPLSKSETTAGPATTMEDHGIGPRMPYPTGNPPPPAEDTSYSQGIKGVTDKPSAKPSSSSGPAGEAPKLGDKDAANKADTPDKKPIIPADQSKPAPKDPTR